MAGSQEVRGSNPWVHNRRSTAVYAGDTIEHTVATAVRYIRLR
jgi:hypothetical protein